MNTYLIGTHDSATGEEGRGLLSWLVTPFARTQSKTIKEQLEVGCRYFDIRVKFKGYNDKDTALMGVFYCAHGLWTSKKTAIQIFNEIEDFGEDVHVEITYEGTDRHIEYFKKFVNYIDKTFKHIFFTAVAIKYGDGSRANKVVYNTITKEFPDLKKLGCFHCKQCFDALDGRDLKIYLPIPWFWKKVGKFRNYNSKHIKKYFYNLSNYEPFYNVVDFL